MSSPCLNCESREIGCHSTCSKYREFKASRDAVITQRKHEMAANEVYGNLVRKRNKRIGQSMYNALK